MFSLLHEIWFVLVGFFNGFHSPSERLYLLIITLNFSPFCHVSVFGGSLSQFTSRLELVSVSFQVCLSRRALKHFREIIVDLAPMPNEENHNLFFVLIYLTDDTVFAYS